MAPSLSSLLSQTSLDSNEEILKAANEALKVSKSDLQAQQIRIIALLKLDRYDDALRALETGGPTLQNDAQLEYAYALYKNGKYEEAQKVATKGTKRRSLRHVEAQAAYRQEKFLRARQLYDELAGQGAATMSGEDKDLAVNSGATDTQLCWTGSAHLAKKTKADRHDMELFETAFNAACGYIARGELKQASTLLSKAIDLCKAAEELTEEEKNIELLPIQVQQAYVLARLGQGEEAESLVSSVKIDQITDPPTRHIAQSNALSSATKVSNPFLSHRLFNASSPKLSSPDKPFSYQSYALHRNSLTLDLQAGKTPKSLPKKAPMDADSILSPEFATAGVFRAAALSRNHTGKSGLRQVMSAAEKNPTDVGLLLTAVQLCISDGNTHMAATLLEKLFDRLEEGGNQDDLSVRYAPGLVALQASLYQALNRKFQAKVQLGKAARYWQQMASPDRELGPLFARTGTTLLENATPSDRETAYELFGFLHARNKDDPAALAGLAASSGTLVDSRNAAQSLPSLVDATRGVDAEALESAGIAKLAQVSSPSHSKKRPAAESQQQGPSKPAKARKIRPSRMPKDFDPNKKMDPERWLPQRDRSNWRPKGKKKGKAAASTQGGLTTEDARPSTPSSVLQTKGGSGQGKKKKGKK